MKKQLFVTTIVCICALAMVDFSRAADPNIHIEWSYANPPADLVGFHLYVNDAQVQDFNVPTAISWSGPVVLVDGNNTFELTPYDVVGQEGARCAPYVKSFDAPPDSTGLMILNVVIN